MTPPLFFWLVSFVAALVSPACLGSESLMEEAQASETRRLCASALTPLRHACQQRAGFTAAYERVWSVCTHIMGWPAVVLSGRQAGRGGVGWGGVGWQSGCRAVCAWGEGAEGVVHP